MTPKNSPSPAAALPPDVMAPFPSRLAEVLSDLDCVSFRREMSVDGEIRYTWFSDNVSDIFGCAPEEMTTSAKGWLNSVHWADREAHAQALRLSAERLQHSREEFRAITGGGETRWFKGSAAPVRLADGRVVWDGTWIDITPWRRAEQKFETVMDHAEDCIITLDAERGIEWANAAAERLFGFPLNELAGRCLSDLLYEPCRFSGAGRSQNCPVPDISHCFSRSTREVTARRKDGTPFPFEMTVSDVRTDGRLSLIVIGRDITRRKTTEMMLEESERRLRTIASNLPGVVFQRVQNPDGSFSYPYVSDGIAEILGRQPEEIVHDCSLLFDAMLEEDRQRLLAALNESAASLGPVREDVRVTGWDGRLRWLRGESRPRRRDGIIVWDGLLLDVTEEVEERLKAETAVRESEERFRQGFAAASIGIVITSPDGRLQNFNPAFRRMCGNDERCAIGGNMRDFIDAPLPEPGRLQPHGAPVVFDHMPQLADGQERHWHITLSQFSASSDAKKPSLLYLVDDVTDIVRAEAERRQLETALQEGQKLEALGRLAGGVAHELNNMLGPILMGAEMMMRGGALDEKNRERCVRIIEAAKHGREIVRNVLAYCRKEEKTLGLMDLVPVVRQFVSLATSILPPTVKVESDIAVEQAWITGDAVQLQQILLNMANNARDAMDGVGRLSLTLTQVPPGGLAPPKPRPGQGHGPPDPFAGLDHGCSHVELRVSDTGSGMTPAVMAKIFDPFFTTKPVGQGTGLGLSVVQGLIKGMGGAIACESRLGEGTTFRIALPLLPPPAEG